jgi:hypothetical protein
MSDMLQLVVVRVMRPLLRRPASTYLIMCDAPQMKKGKAKLACGALG